VRCPRRSLSLAACLVALAAPGTALAQTPGDEQYTDPFGGSQDEGAAPGNEEEAAPQPTATPAPEPAPAAPAAQAEAAPEAAPEVTPAQELPRTGTDALITLVSGAVLLGGGVALRLRLRGV
jgi:LPXTG-motif cell wall-anchored protein